MLKKAKEALSFDDRKQFASFFELLLNVEKRMKLKKGMSNKNRKSKSKGDHTGSHYCGPLYFINTYFYNQVVLI